MLCVRQYSRSSNSEPVFLVAYRSLASFEDGTRGWETPDCSRSRPLCFLTCVYWYLLHSLRDAFPVDSEHGSLTPSPPGTPNLSHALGHALWLRYAHTLPADPDTAVYHLDAPPDAPTVARVRDGAFPLGPGPDPPRQAEAACRQSPHHLLNVRRFVNDTALPGLAVAPRWAADADAEATGPADADEDAPANAEAGGEAANDEEARRDLAAQVQVRVRWKLALSELFTEERLRQTLSRRWVRDPPPSILHALLFSSFRPPIPSSNLLGPSSGLPFPHVYLVFHLFSLPHPSP